ncbi:MAG: histidine kinase dimerization/phosphoacceptor domain -containing protein, partial [Spirochaetota bacterium]
MAETRTLDLGILEMLPVGLFAVDRDWRITLWNRSLADWTGIAASSALGRGLSSVLPRMGERLYMSRLESVMAGGPPVVFSYQIHVDLFPVANDHGLRRSRYCTASALPDARGVLFTVEDRTEVAALVREARAEVRRRREVEEALRAALVTKAMLVREASHRVKNNLGMIVSLIGLEAERAGSEAARGFLVDLETRIDSISLIH